MLLEFDWNNWKNAMPETINMKWFKKYVSEIILHILQEKYY